MPFKHLFKYALFACLTLLFVYITTSFVFAENLIQNGGFEDGASGWYPFGATISQSSDYNKINNFSGKMQTSSTASGTKYIYSVVSVIGGKNYKASAFAVKQGEANANTLLKVAFYQSSNGTGPQIDGVSYASPKINQNTTEFQLLETDTITAPATAASARIRPSIEMPTGATQNGIAYLDDIKFEEVTPSTPAPSIIPTLTPTPSSTQKPTSSFTITNIPSQINVNQSFNASINLNLPNNKNTDYYLGGAFKKTDGTRYFGLTNINSTWVKYESANYLNQYKITTDDSGNWSGSLEAKPDNSDTDYKGSGDYVFKVGRYTSSGSGPTWSNELTINIISSNTPDESPTNTPSSVQSPTPSSTALKKTSSPKTIASSFIYRTASVAAATASATNLPTSSPKVEIKTQKQLNPFIIMGVILIFAACSLIGYIYFVKRHEKIHF